jgi:hypothetical protein
MIGTTTGQLVYHKALRATADGMPPQSRQPSGNIRATGNRSLHHAETGLGQFVN